MISEYQGDIFTAPIGILVHSANCFHKMGAGIARDIKIKYPRAYQADCMTKFGDIRKLGQFSLSAPGEDQPFYILNCYTQHRYGRDKVYVDYDAFFQCMENVKSWIYKMGIESESLGIPYNISCNNAGGSWDKILSIIKYSFEKEPISVLICKKV